MIILLTAPYSGTHFMANTLRLLGADYVYCHTSDYYITGVSGIEMLPKWIRDGGKLIIATRNPWNSIYSAVNRRRNEEDEKRNDPSWTAEYGLFPILDEKAIVNRQIERITKQVEVFEECGGLTIAVDDPPALSDRRGFIEKLSEYCGVSGNQQASEFLSQWPITGSVEYQRNVKPTDLSDESVVADLCIRLGYPPQSNWGVPKNLGSQWEFRREQIRPLIANKRAHVALKPGGRWV